MSRLRLGVIGAGAWGKNHVRTAAGLGDAQLAAVCDADPRTPPAAVAPPPPPRYPLYADEVVSYSAYGPLNAGTAPAPAAPEQPPAAAETDDDYYEDYEYDYEEYDERRADMKQRHDDAEALRRADFEERSARDARNEAVQHQTAEANRRQTKLEQARREAEALSAEARQRMEDFVASRTKVAEQKIAQAETQALQEVRALSADIAISAAERILTAKIKGKASAALIEKSIGDVKAKLN